MEVSGQHRVPAALPLGKNCVPILQEAGDGCGGDKFFLPLPGFESRTVLHKRVATRLRYIFTFDILMSVHRNTFPNYDQQDATFLDLCTFTDALHVSGGSSAHHQEHVTVHTASGIVNQYRCLLLAWMGWNCVPSHPR